MYILIYKNEKLYFSYLHIFKKNILNLQVRKMKLKIKIRICELRVKAKMWTSWMHTWPFTFNNSVIPILSLQEPAWGTPWQSHGRPDKMQAWSGFKGTPEISWASTPKPRVYLPYYIMLFIHSSNINRGPIPHHLFWERLIWSFW